MNDNTPTAEQIEADLKALWDSVPLEERMQNLEEIQAESIVLDAITNLLNNQLGKRAYKKHLNTEWVAELIIDEIINAGYKLVKNV